MCRICIEWELGKMTNKEALANIGETIDSTTDQEQQAHLFELADKVIDKEMPFDEWDSDDWTRALGELDKAFGQEED